MTTTLDKKSKLLTAVFQDISGARLALQDLRSAGVPDEEMAIISSGDYYPQRAYRVTDGQYLKRERDAVEKGSEAGAALGGAGGLLLGLGSLALPWVGPMLGLGSIFMGMIAGMSLGALAGGAAGVLMELGYSREQADKMSAALGEGQALVVIKSGAVARHAAHEIVRRHEPLSVEF